MSNNSESFERWIRTSFVEMNTELEETYFKQERREAVEGVGDAIKTRICGEGHDFIVRLLAEGNTDEGFDNAFDLLGDLGLYLAALRRHELTNPAREEKSPFQEASALGLHIAASVGMAPRFATAHLATRNAAVNGRQKSFTTLKDEFLFLDYNTRGIFSFMRCADALMRILPLGVSHPVTETLLQDAASALRAVIKYNDTLYKELDADRFFYSVRPYYKPYRVGRHEYRGANAGDFSGINEIDMLLGLCQANDPYYAQLLVDKMLFMTPEDQASLRDCMRQRSILAQFLDVAPESAKKPWFKRNAAAFLEVCRLHGETAVQHHDQLVKRFIEKPSAALEADKLAQVTASGPPLPVLLRALETLRDMRNAADRNDIRTSYKEIEALKAYVSA
ncbi:monodechloroaminopyrrolnitrin synthase PrnB family protein [Marinicaulis aureus]|uniref:Monodechloroaminopyrrolnitrin synthase PrnB family protein n=1 Tax=Hyphococcus aureus TaxID=2666033 RepID=A0ABW1KQK1_9PROT